MHIQIQDDSNWEIVEKLTKLIGESKALIQQIEYFLESISREYFLDPITSKKKEFILRLKPFNLREEFETKLFEGNLSFSYF